MAARRYDLNLVFDVKNLPALVHAGFRIDAVRLHRFSRFFVQLVLRNFQSVMGAPLSCPRFGMSPFWIWHKLLLNTKSKRLAFVTPALS